MTPNDLRTMRTALMGRLKEIIKLPRPNEIVPASASLMDAYSSSAKDPANQRSGQPHSKNEYEDDAEFLPSAHLIIELDIKPNPVPHLPPPESPSPSSRRNADLLLTCTYCNYECANGQDAMERHLMIRHPETFFMSQRNNSSSPSWKNEHFKEIVMEIVFPKFILTDGSSTSCSCSVCGKKYSKCKSITVNSNLMTVHVLSEHLQEVRESLKGIMGQSDALLRKKLDKPRKNLKPIAPWKVEDCYSSSRDSKGLDKPEDEDKPLSPPPEQLQSMRTRRSGLDSVKILTGKEQKKKSKKKVKVKKHPKKKFQRQNIDSNIISTTSSKEKGIHICKSCNKTFPYRQSAQRHWKYFCMKRETNGALLPPISSKRTGKTICKFCNKSFTHFVSAQRHMKYSCPKKPPEEDTDSLSKLACAYCDYGCAKGELMKRHLVRRHPEMFFLSERESFLSRWNNEQEQVFKMIVEEIVFPKFILRDNVISSSCSCSICGKNFSKDEKFSQNRKGLKMHLINDHIQKVREYLQDIIMCKSDEASLLLQEKLGTGSSLKLESESEVQDVTTPSSSFSSPPTTSKKSKYNCKFCNESFTRLFSLQRHLRYSCPKGQRLTRPKSPPREDAGLKLTCTYCNYECANRPSDMKRHLGVCHPETFFLSMFEEKTASLSEWKNEYCKTIVIEIVFPKFILTDGISVSCSCSVCGRMYSKARTVRGNRNKMTLHLINEHMNEVREHLTDIITESDASLQEQLDNMQKQKFKDKLMRSVTIANKSTNLCHESLPIKLEQHNHNHNSSLPRGQDTMMDVDETLINNLLGI